jgi:hypothetical protein
MGCVWKKSWTEPIYEPSILEALETKTHQQKRLVVPPRLQDNESSSTNRTINTDPVIGYFSHLDTFSNDRLLILNNNFQM